MSPVTHLKNFSHRESVEWIVSEYESVERRKDLIERYNYALGLPNEFITQVHNDFLNYRMQIDEVMAFVLISEELIYAAQQWRQEFAEISSLEVPHSPRSSQEEG
jgi:hypothetical protein